MIYINIYNVISFYTNSGVSVPENVTDIQLKLRNSTKATVALGNDSLTNDSVITSTSKLSELASPAAEYWK